jgi:hypothetical protein
MVGRVAAWAWFVVILGLFAVPWPLFQEAGWWGVGMFLGFTVPMVVGYLLSRID